MKICAGCEKELPKDCFSKRQFQLNKSTRRCKNCIEDGKEVSTKVADSGDNPSWMAKKKEATKRFQQKEWSDSAALYGEALRLLRTSTAAGEQERKEEEVKLLANLALCDLSAENAAAAIEHCNMVLLLQPGHAKALYRRAKAHEMQGNSLRAYNDCRKCYEVAGSQEALRECHRYKAEWARMKKHYVESLVKNYACDPRLVLDHEDWASTLSKGSDPKPWHVHSFQQAELGSEGGILDDLGGSGGLEGMKEFFDTFNKDTRKKQQAAAAQYPLEPLEDVDWREVAALLFDLNKKAAYFLPVLFNILCNTAAGQNSNPFRFLVAGLKGRIIKLDFMKRLEHVKAILLTFASTSNLQYDAARNSFLPSKSSIAVELQGADKTMRIRKLTEYLLMLLPLFYEKYCGGLDDNRVLVAPRGENEGIAANVVAGDAWRFINLFWEAQTHSLFAGLSYCTFMESVLYPNQQRMGERERAEREADFVGFVSRRLSSAFETCRMLFGTKLTDFEVEKDPGSLLAELSLSLSHKETVAAFVLDRMPQFLNLPPPPVLQSREKPGLGCFFEGSDFREARFLRELNDFPPRLVRKIFHQMAKQTSISILGGVPFVTEFTMLKKYETKGPTAATVKEGSLVHFVSWTLSNANRRQDQTVDPAKQYEYIVFEARADFFTNFHASLKPGNVCNCLHTDGSWHNAVIAADCPATIASNSVEPQLLDARQNSITVHGMPELPQGRIDYFWVQEVCNLTGNIIGPLCCVHKLCLRPFSQLPGRAEVLKGQHIRSGMLSHSQSVSSEGIYRLPACEEGQLFKRSTCPKGPQNSSEFEVAEPHWRWITILAREWWEEASLPLAAATFQTMVKMPASETSATNATEHALEAENVATANQVTEEQRREPWTNLDQLFDNVAAMIDEWKPVGEHEALSIFNIVEAFLTMRSHHSGFASKQEPVKSVGERLGMLRLAVNSIEKFVDAKSFVTFFKAVLETSMDAEFAVHIVAHLNTVVNERDGQSGLSQLIANEKALNKFLERLLRKHDKLASLPTPELRTELQSLHNLVSGTAGHQNNIWDSFTSDEPLCERAAKLIEDCSYFPAPSKCQETYQVRNLSTVVAKACVQHNLENEMRSVYMVLKDINETRGLTRADLRFESKPLSPEKHRERIEGKVGNVLRHFCEVLTVRSEWCTSREAFHSVLCTHELWRWLDKWHNLAREERFCARKIVTEFCRSVTPCMLQPHGYPNEFQRRLENTTSLIHHAMDIDSVEKVHHSFPDPFRTSFLCQDKTEEQRQNHRHPFHPSGNKTETKLAWSYILDLFEQLVDQDVDNDTMSTSLKTLTGLYKELRVDYADYLKTDSETTDDNMDNNDLTVAIIFDSWMNRVVGCMRRQDMQECYQISGNETRGTRLAKVLNAAGHAYTKLLASVASCKHHFPDENSSVDIMATPFFQVGILGKRNERLWGAPKGIEFIATKYASLKSSEECIALSRALNVCDFVYDVDPCIQFLLDLASAGSVQVLAESKDWNIHDFLRFCSLLRIKEANLPSESIRLIQDDEKAKNLYHIYQVSQRFNIPDLSGSVLNLTNDYEKDPFLKKYIEYLAALATDEMIPFDIVAVTINLIQAANLSVKLLKQSQEVRGPHYHARLFVAWATVLHQRLPGCMQDIWIRSSETNKKHFVKTIDEICTIFVELLSEFNIKDKIGTKERSRPVLDAAVELHGISLLVLMILQLLPITDCTEECIVKLCSIGPLLEHAWRNDSPPRFSIRTSDQARMLSKFEQERYTSLDPALPMFLPHSPSNYVHLERNTNTWLTFNAVRPLHIEFSPWMSINALHLRASRTRIAARLNQIAEARQETYDDDSMVALFTRKGGGPAVSLYTSAVVLKTIEGILAAIEKKAGGECFIPFPAQFVQNSVLFRGLGDRDGAQRSFASVVDFLCNGFSPADLTIANPFGQSSSKAGQYFFTHALETASHYLSADFKDGALLAVDANHVNHWLACGGGRLEREGLLQLCLYSLPLAAIRLCVLPGEYQSDLQTLYDSREADPPLENLMTHTDFQTLSTSQLERIRDTLNLQTEGQKPLWKRIAFFRPHDFERVDLSKFVEMKLIANGDSLIESKGFGMMLQTMHSVLAGWAASRGYESPRRKHLFQCLMSTVLGSMAVPSTLEEAFTELDDAQFACAFVTMDDFFPRIVWLQNLIAQSGRVGFQDFFSEFKGLVNSGMLQKYAQAQQEKCGDSLLQKLGELLQPLEYDGSNAFLLSTDVEHLSQVSQRRLLLRVCFLGLLLPELIKVLKDRFSVTLSVDEFVKDLFRYENFDKVTLQNNVLKVLDVYVEICADLRDNQALGLLVATVEDIAEENHGKMLKDIVTQLICVRTASFTSLGKQRILNWQKNSKSNLSKLFEIAFAEWGPNADAV